MDLDKYEKSKKKRVISSTNTIINPRTMMVINTNTFLTIFTMFASQWFKYFTILANLIHIKLL
jgi:hypothetical protein